jgi:hypothetical protein
MGGANIQVLAAIDVESTAVVNIGEVEDFSEYFQVEDDYLFFLVSVYFLFFIIFFN